MTSTIPLETLRCPNCEAALTASDDALTCASCGDSFPLLLGTPRLLVPSLRQELLGKPSARPAARAVVDEDTDAKLRAAASFSFEWQRFQFHQLRADWEKNFLDYMQPRGPEFFRGKRVLDAGCGSGRHTYYAAKFGAEVVAVDLSDAIDVARANTGEIGQVCTIQADLYNLPFASESFDFIYCIGVLHHLPDPEAAFRNLLRYLKPGGEIQIYVYWRPEGWSVKRALLSIVDAMRCLTIRLPHRLLYGLSYPLAGLAYAGFVLPYRLLRSVPGTAGLAERLPMRQYADYSFRVCVNDQFDRFSTPIENRYTKAEIEAWLERAGLEKITVLPNWGWLGSGRKPRNY
jgi:SAM-dependent methyltransferase/uncharacterized protein YbaR (Trm112 family)